MKMQQQRVLLVSLLATVGLIAASAIPATATAEPTRDSSSCTAKHTHHTHSATDLAPMPIRTGPGKTYNTKARLDSLGYGFMKVLCTARNPAGNVWYYGDALSVNGKYVRGWVWDGNLSQD
ncbi:hypothetical protein ACIOEX_11115 [Streptomyces sp. NPDC087850]|uniref:hypothetical protein n=1 Tax=Streptomyces sp. NPDC087850 TaxID=3365809 RepID=UPI0037F4D6A0